MPLERKPLFNPRLLESRLAGFRLPEPVNAKQAVIGRWRTA